VTQNKIITTQAIEDVVNKSSSDRIPVRDLVDAMQAIGFGLVMMIFAFGIIIPLPPPFPSIIAMPLIIFSLQMIAGYTAPKLPKRFEKITVKRSVVAMLVQKSAPYIRKVEHILRPRLGFVTTPRAERVIGVFALIFSSFIVLPMPLSNFIPGLGILIISFGLLGKDGLVVICGIIVGLVGIAISTTAVLLGVEALYYIKNFFLN
jgi:hypothetical protein